MPQLRTGVAEPELRPAAAATIVGRRSVASPDPLAGAYLELSLPPRDSGLRGAKVVVHGHESALAVVGDDGTLLVHFPDSPPAGELTGTLFVRGRVWTAMPFRAPVLAPVPEADDLPRRWAEAYASDLRTQADRAGGPHPWHTFAAARLRGLAQGETRGAAGVRRQPVRRDGIAELMATSTGMASLQESLQHDRGLRTRVAFGERDVPIADVDPAQRQTHPWSEMLAHVPKADPAAEPLAAAAPAGFWYFRFDSLATLGVCLEQAEDWLIPARRIADEQGYAHRIIERYRTQLGLSWSAGDALAVSGVSRGVALVGSDPYLREGSDVTAIFAADNAAAMTDALARMRTRSANESQTRATAETIAGHRVEVFTHPGGLRQHVVVAAGYVVVSNSPGALGTVLAVIDGQAQSLAGEPDFRYLRARDPARHNALFFASDRFIGAVVGPAQKILESRRQRALSELLTPGYAALLYGWLRGRAPTSVPDVIHAGLLDKSELAHADGEEIQFTLLAGAHSSWGSPDTMTPLIDRAAPTHVSAAERDAYRDFAEGYRDYWSQAIDPVAAGIDLEHDAEGMQLQVEARVLPVVENTAYDDIREIVGEARVQVPSDLPGLRMTWAVGADVRLRRRMDRLAKTLGHGDLQLGWLGGWVEFGVLDRRALAVVTAALDGRIQLPSAQHEERGLAGFAALSDAPLYLAAEVRNPAALAATLIAARGAAMAAAPGMIEWAEHSKHRGHAIVEVRGPTLRSTPTTMYYAVADDVLVVALTLPTMQVVLDRLATGRGPAPAQQGSQFVLDVAAKRSQGLGTTLAWLLHGNALQAQRAALLDAEVLLRGYPGLGPGRRWDAIALQTFGAVPVDAAGSTQFAMGPVGARSPRLGSEVAPQFPPLPVAGSPAQAIVDHLGALRAEIGFDPEPGSPGRSSLHIRLTTRVR